MRPINSCVRLLTYPLSKYLAKPLNHMKHRDGNSIKNSKEFADFIVSQVIEEDEIVVSFDVVALFTSIPIPLAIQVVDDKLKEDESWMQFTSFNRNHIIELLKLVFENSIFKFEGVYYHQIIGCAMGSPRSVP